jgi:GGDEF domain-containing protein
MLRQCADALVRSLRAVDDLARTGPDEFSVLLADTTETPTLMETAARARKRMEVVRALRKQRGGRDRAA